MFSFENVHFGGSSFTLLVVALTCIILVLLIPFILFLSGHLFTKPCAMPGMSTSQIFLYLLFLKGIYKQSTEAYPPLCLALQALCGCCRIFEREKIWRFYLGLKPVVIFFSAETIEVILSSSSLISKAREYEFLHPWLGTGLLTSTGAKWRYRRKLLTPAFHFSLLEDFIPIFHEQSIILTSKLKTLSEHPWVDVVPLMTACTLDIICETAMGIHIGAQSGGYRDYVQAIHDVGDIFLYRAMRPWLHPDIIFNLSRKGQKFNENIKIIQGFTRKVIKEKKANMLTFNSKYLTEDETVSNDSPSHMRKRRAFLELLLKQHFKDPSFTEEDIREEVDTFMFEGHDTTAMALSWTLYFLGLDENVQKAVHDELDKIFQNDMDREATREDLSQMKYLECVIKESLRLHPSVPFLGRVADQSFKVLDHTVHKGSICFIFPIMLHQDARYFKKPEHFIPERFFPEHCVGRHPYSYVPFSAGPRNCIGQKFALIEEKTVLANILRRFRVTSLDPRDKVHLFPNLVTRNVQPLRLRFIPRE